MSEQLCPDWRRRFIAIASLILLLLFSGPATQMFVVFTGAITGLILCRGQTHLLSDQLQVRHSERTAWLLLVVFFALLFLLPFLSGQNSLLAVIDAFYRAGALVFGGGHVVLPLLETTVVEPGWVAADEYLAGYGAAQAVPGPVFSVAAYLGAMLPGDNGGLTGAVVALAAIFLPGFLLISAVLPLWKKLANYPAAANAVAGVNAAVVGLLAAALYDPIWVSVVNHISDIIIAMIGFVLLHKFKWSALLVVLWCVFASIGLTLL